MVKIESKKSFGSSVTPGVRFMYQTKLSFLLPIERNFQPPLLFRDIRELGNEKATTAYGGLATVPGNCDILIGKSNL